jgi:2-keto-4-pentenoate hydratase
MVDVAAVAAELLAMRREQRIEVDLPGPLRPGDLATAYAVQGALVDALLAKGGRPIGFKAACTSAIAQAALQVHEPLFGRLLSSSSHPSGVVLQASDFVHRVIESEFAFRLGADVPIAEGHTAASVARCVDAVIPAIEIVDYRYADWKIGARQVAADNAIHGAWVYGEAVEAVDLTALDTAGVSVRLNGNVVTTGSGAAVLGHPLKVLAWLAGELPRHGLALRAGDVITTGVTTDVIEACAGDTIVSTFQGVGEVRVSFR